MVYHQVGAVGANELGAPLRGAAHRVGKNETAWSYRDATWAEIIVGVDPDPAYNPRLIRWANAFGFREKQSVRFLFIRSGYRIRGKGTLLHPR